jgi:UDP-2,3-diacylglucosamine hydrolase
MAMSSGPGSSGERIWFLADAHLDPASTTRRAGRRSQDDPRVRDLLSFLAVLPERASDLYLVGDIFDFWFEYRWGVTVGHEAVLDALRCVAAAGVSVRFLGGNHDYWAGAAFERMSGARVHRRPVNVTHCGRRLFIAHGDGLPRGDRWYKALKATIRSGPAIAAFRLVPPSVGAAIGRWASGLSEITDERIERAMSPMREFLFETLQGPFDAAVVGHVHRPAHWSTSDGEALIVGDWQDNRSAMLLDDDGFRHFRWQDDALVPVAPVTGGRTNNA